MGQSGDGVAFLDLKRRFTSALILLMPVPNRWCSRKELRAIRFTPAPSSLTSLRLNEAIGLRAIESAFEEWRHLFEGTAGPFVVWTDHRKEAQPPSSPLASVFQSLQLHHHLLSENAQPDALSQLYSPAHSVIRAKLQHSSCSLEPLVSATQVKLTNTMESGLRSHPASADCSPRPVVRSCPCPISEHHLGTLVCPCLSSRGLPQIGSPVKLVLVVMYVVRNQMQTGIRQNRIQSTKSKARYQNCIAQNHKAEIVIVIVSVSVSHLPVKSDMQTRQTRARLVVYNITIDWLTKIGVE